MTTVMRRVGGFFVRFLLLFVMAVLPWPGLNDAYGGAFRAGANLLFESFGSDRTIRFLPPGPLKRTDLPRDFTLPATNEVVDTRIELGSRANPQQVVYSQIGSRHVGYIPSAFLLALILATSVPWRQRLNAVLLGLVALNVYVAFRVAVSLTYSFCQGHPLALFAPSPFWAGAIGHLFHLFVTSLTGSFLGPILLWPILTLRRGDLARLFASRQGRLALKLSRRPQPSARR